MPPVLLSTQNLAKSFGARPLFEGLSFGLFEGERTGLIGPNGTGKSTLIKILAGLDKPDEGQVVTRKGLRVAYVSQNEEFPDPQASPTQVLIQALEPLKLDEHERDLRIEAGLTETGFDDQVQTVGALSGGWRKRLAVLAQVLKEPDLLLLDEPSNHMDLEGVLWLERFLGKQRFSFLVITHDRRFLEKVTNRIIELNKRYPEGYFSCEGNYSRFLEKREELFNSQTQRESSVANIVRREIEWLRRGPKARGTKQQARIDRAGDFIEELDELKHRNSQGRAAGLDFSGSSRSTRRLIELVKVHKNLGGRQLFNGLDLLLAPGSKLGLLGANGSGKSTLLRMISGELEPDSGSRKEADTLTIARFDQHRAQLDLNATLRFALCGHGEHVQYRGQNIHVGGWAKRFLFTNEQLDLQLKRLSGGEQARVLIARLMLEPADVLLLDEPTNDLDIASLEVLEQSLLDFPGALVLVTHDRYLLDRVSQRLLALDGQGRAELFADYDQWEESEKMRAKEARGKGNKPAPTAPALAVTAEPGAALSTKERQELKNMEGTIAKAEAKLVEAQKALEDPAIAADAAALMDRQAKVAQAQGAIDTLLARWQELEAKQGQA